MATISNNDIAQSIFLSSKGKTPHELPLYLKNVVNVLNKKRLLSRSPEILARLKKLVDREEGIITAKVWSARKLANQTKHDLVHPLIKHYKGKEVFFEEVVDDKLIGGFKVKVGDEVMDFTLKNRINKLKGHLITG